MKKLFLLLFLVAVSVQGGKLRAQEAVDALCPNAELLGPKLFTDICWGCIFPIRVAGFDIFPGEDAAPAKAAKESVCMCEDSLGIPTLGLGMGMWQPARLMELVRTPGCSMALGGFTLPITSQRFRGTDGRDENDSADLVFYHVHNYAFPLLYMLELFLDSDCIGDGYLDFDLLDMSEVDPTWNNDELGFFQSPEAALLANPVALAACAADAATSSAGYPLDEMFWCAGTWGNMYPLSGHTKAFGSLAQNTSMLATKKLAIDHRRGLNWRTMGEDAMCSGGGVIDVMITKSQYKMSMFYPLAEANGSHQIGETTFRWGEHRKIPGVGEDTLYNVFRWNDCCMRF
ncbi:MAG: TraU family protein [Porticoccaceae bacterium]